MAIGVLVWWILSILMKFALSQRIERTHFLCGINYCLWHFAKNRTMVCCVIWSDNSDETRWQWVRMTIVIAIVLCRARATHSHTNTHTHNNIQLKCYCSQWTIKLSGWDGPIRIWISIWNGTVRTIANDLLETKNERYALHIRVCMWREKKISVGDCEFGVSLAQNKIYVTETAFT